MAVPVSTLPPDLRADLGDHDLVVFDGECVLCSRFFRYMWRHDRAERFRYALAQSPLGTRLYDALGLPTDAFETNLVIVEGRIYQKLDAFAAAMRALGGVRRAAGLVRLLPRAIKDPLYLGVARNRYALFGRFDSCMVPTPKLRARFLPGGWG